METKKRRIRSFLEFFLAVAVLTGFDQWTKAWAVSHLKGQEDITLIPDVLYFHYLENRGAAFGIFQDQRTFLLLLTTAIILAVCYALWRMPEGKRYLPMKGLCFLVTAGGLGNLIDRVSQNYVVDFIYFSPIHFPVFNVADIYVTVSMVLLFLLLFFYYKDEDLKFLSRKAGKGR